MAHLKLAHDRRLFANSEFFYLGASKAFMQRTCDEDEPPHLFKKRLKLVEDCMKKRIPMGIAFLPVGV